MFSEFKKFIMRGNVLDLAIGVIIGGGVRENRHVDGERHSDAGDRSGYWEKSIFRTCLFHLTAKHYDTLADAKKAAGSDC